MIDSPLVDEIRSGAHAGLEALEIQLVAVDRMLKQRLKPADARRLRAACDHIVAPPVDVAGARQRRARARRLACDARPRRR